MYISNGKIQLETYTKYYFLTFLMQMNTNVTQKEAKLGLIANITQNWTKYIF